MFIALDEYNKRTSIADAEKDKQYFCPICNAPLIIKEGKIYTKHFAHKIGSICYDNWTHDMSAWHLNWQEKFPRENREIVVTNGEKKHRADVLINNTVIEFQHSKITKEEINERNQFYTSCGYKVIWVFDADNKIKNAIENPNKIDPLICSDFDLCWKRKNNQFDFNFRKGPILSYGDISIFLQYSWHNQSILIKLKSISSKNFEFFKTLEYIKEENFVSNFIPKENVKSYQQIIKEAFLYKRNKSITYSRPTYNFFVPRPKKRRWHL